MNHDRSEMGRQPTTGVVWCAGRIHFGDRTSPGAPSSPLSFNLALPHLALGSYAVAASAAVTFPHFSHLLSDHSYRSLWYTGSARASRFNAPCIYRIRNYDMGAAAAFPNRSNKPELGARRARPNGGTFWAAVEGDKKGVAMGTPLTEPTLRIWPAACTLQVCCPTLPLS
jgi:hypothetical protein